MTNQAKTTDDRGTLIVDQTRDGHRLQVFQTQNDQDASITACVGYFDGQRSVTGTRPDIVANALVKKHLTAIPPKDRGVVIDFATARALRKGGYMN
ncbi:hypothetical protein BAJUN_03310 [Bajunvirus bajun]|uniref:Uncharacterized protein n=1 Tax=Brevundimonas phage vB_BgoS-Bajun TaxID=2948594 RepID=A0A9E7N4W0_9CAUD|nr:hypothetical protein BAJUN_03310 [Brevundimonas phage vB_BgoS-Bajun]